MRLRTTVVRGSYFEQRRLCVLVKYGQPRFVIADSETPTAVAKHGPTYTVVRDKCLNVFQSRVAPRVGSLRVLLPFFPFVVLLSFIRKG